MVQAKENPTQISTSPNKSNHTKIHIRVGNKPDDEASSAAIPFAESAAVYSTTATHSIHENEKVEEHISKNKSDTSEKNQIETDHSLIENAKPYVDIISTIFMVIFTGALAWSTKKLTDETQRLRTLAAQQANDTQAAIETAKASVEIARKPSESYAAAERAWLGVVGLSTITHINAIDQHGQLKSGISFCMNWVNSGRTPAMNCRDWSESRIVGKHQECPKFDMSTRKEDKPPGILVPGADFMTRGSPIEDRDIEKLVRGDIRIFIYTLVEYSSVMSPDNRCVVECTKEVFFMGHDERKQKLFQYANAGSQNATT